MHIHLPQMVRLSVAVEDHDDDLYQRLGASVRGHLTILKGRHCVQDCIVLSVHLPAQQCLAAMRLHENATTGGLVPVLCNNHNIFNICNACQDGKMRIYRVVFFQVR